MVERKSGPVKPPVLDLEARKKPDAEKPNQTAGAKQQSAKQASTPDEPRPEKSNTVGALPFSIREINLIGIGGLASILVSVALSYTIASLGYWPNANLDQQPTAFDTKLAALEDQILAISENPASAFAPDTTGRLDALNQKFDELSEVITSLETRVASAENQPSITGDATDLTPINNQIEALKTQLDSLATGLVAAQNLGEKAASKSEIAALQDRLTDIEAQPAPQPPIKEPTGLDRLPLALAGLETAFGSGRAYAAELSLIGEALPTLEIPTALADRAETGLPSPQAAIRAFEARIPHLLAARPADPDMSWQDALLARAQALLAMRPTDDLTEVGPTADIARIEQALSIFDFKTAADLSATLPAAMRAAGGTTLTDIEALAASADFAKAARTAALSPPAPVEAN